MLDLDKLSEKISDYKYHPTDLIGRYVVNVVDTIYVKDRKICKITNILLSGFKIEVDDGWQIYNFSGGRKVKGSNMYDDRCYLLTEDEVTILRSEIKESNMRKKLIEKIAVTNFNNFSTAKLTEIVKVIETGLKT